MKTVSVRIEKTGRGGREETPRDAEWQTVRLDDVASTSSGGTPPRSRPDYYRGTVPWAKIEDLTRNGMWLRETEEQITEAATHETNAKVFPARTVLVAMYGSIGTTSIAALPVSCNQAILGCECGPNLHPEYLYYWFSLVRRLLLARGRGGTQANLNAGIVNALSIPLPPLAEQERIAGRLTEQLAAVERARGAAKERLAAAEALPAAYLREVFEGPEASGWEKPTITDIAEVQGGYAFKSDWFTQGGVRLLRNANIHQGFIEWDDVVFVSPDRARELPTLALAEGDIVLTLDRPIVAGGLKAARLCASDLPALLNQRVARFNLDSNRIDADYFYAFLRSKAFIGGLPKHDHSLGVPHVSPGQVGEIAVPLPPFPDQRRIAADLAARLAGAERLAEGIRAELAAIEALPAALLREAFGGSGDSEVRDG